jgi:hypothetical protein
VLLLRALAVVSPRAEVNLEDEKLSNGLPTPVLKMI